MIETLIARRFRSGRLFEPILIGLFVLAPVMIALFPAPRPLPPAEEEYRTVALVRFAATKGPAEPAPTPAPLAPGPAPAPIAPPPSGPESGPAPAPEEPAPGTAALRRDYLGQVIRHVSRHKRYPRLEKGRGDQGEVIVGFEIQKNGTVRHLRLIKPGPRAGFNTEALACVKRSQPLPLLPPSLGDSLPLKIKLKFRLDQ